jgi:hypothetical protein
MTLPPIHRRTSVSSSIPASTALQSVMRVASLRCARSPNDAVEVIEGWLMRLTIVDCLPPSFKSTISVIAIRRYNAPAMWDPRQRAFDVLMLIGAIVFVAAVAIWIRGYFQNEQFWFRRWHYLTAEPSYPIDSYHYGVRWSRGSVAFFRIRRFDQSGGVPPPGWGHDRTTDRWDLIQRPDPTTTLNIEYRPFQLYADGRKIRTGWMTRQNLVLPAWIFLPTAIAPLLWWRRRRRLTRRGFDVERATPVIVADHQ